MNPLRAPLPPHRHSLPWFRNQLRRLWAETSNNAKIVSFLLTLIVIYFLGSISFRFVFGVFYYGVYYFRAVFWDNVIEESCITIKSEPTPFWSLSFSEYMRLSRCLGNEAGFDRQGQLLEGIWDELIHTLNLFGGSPILLLIFIISMFYIVPWIFRRSLGIVIYSLATPRIVALMTVLIPIILYVFGFVNQIILVIFIAVILSAFVFQCTFEDVAQGFQAGTQSTIFVPIASILSYLATQITSTWQILHDIPWIYHRECIHARLCQCQTKLDLVIDEADQQNQSLAMRNQLLQDALADSNLRITDLQTAARDCQVERDNFKFISELPRQNNTTQNFGGCALCAWGTNRPNPDLTAALDEARSRIARHLAELDNEKALRARDLVAHQANLDRLQAQVNYSQVAGQDRSETQIELENTKAQIRALERGLKEMTLTASSLRMELAKEKQCHSEKCQNRAVCQRQILELQVICDKYRNYQLENDNLARTSARRLRGLSAEDVAHITIRSYLAEMTAKFLEFQAKGTLGLSTTNLQVELIHKEYADQTALKERLERELERLGGDVIAVRMGRDTTRPQDWKTETLTYEQNHYRIFSIYEELTQTVINLQDLLLRVCQVAIPAWHPEPARNDATQWHAAHPPNELQVLLQHSSANTAVNPTALHEDSLREKLVERECQRWYNRGVQLLAIFNKVCSNSSSRALATKEQIAHLEGISKASDRVLNKVLQAVFMAAVMLKRDETERQPTPREKKRFEIYTAMQHSITALTNSIIENQKEVLRWSILLPAKNQPIKHPDELATHLVIQEMVTLEARINQLRLFMIDYQLPGTIHGPIQSQIQGDNGRYSTEFNNRVAAMTFSELTMAHWIVWKAQKPEQAFDENGVPVLDEKKEPVFRPRPSTDVQLLPLKWEDFMVAIKMKNAEVKEQEKNRWPEDQSPMLVIDPQLGPRIKFVPNSELEKKNSQNNNTGNNNGTKNDTGSDVDKRKVRQEWETNSKRIQQLSNHVRDWGIKGSIALPVIKQLAKNASLQTTQAQILTQNGELAMLSNIITSNNRQIPKWPKNGGPMKPR